MKNKLLLFFTIALCSGFLYQGFGQDITFVGCTNEGLGSDGYRLSPYGSTTDEGITRTTYRSEPNSQAYFEVIIIRWNSILDRWEILHNAFDPNVEASNELIYFSSVATYPNPPNIAIGNWTNSFEYYPCDPLDATHGELSGDVADTAPEINIDPTVTGLPAEITITEDPPLIDIYEFDISSTQIDDVDLGSGELTLILAADGGRFSLAAPGGPFSLGGHYTSRITITGTLDQVNNYINHPSNIIYIPKKDLSGNDAASIDVFINDNGNTGTGGGNDIYVGTIIIHITPVNDAPVITVPLSINVVENVISPLTGISFSDVDAGSGTMNVGLSIPQGTLSATFGGGVNFNGSGTGNLQLFGTLQDINSFIANSYVSFQNESGNSLDQILTISVNDNGNTGSGGNLSSSASTSLVLAPAPAKVIGVVAPVNQTYTQQENLDFIVNYDKSVNVNTGSGTPSLLLTVGSSSLNANYISGSGSSSLLFRYTVQVGDEDTDGVEVNTLALNGGTITNGGVNVTLALVNIGNTDNVLVDAVAPSGHTVSIDQATITASNETDVSFTFTGAEVGANYIYTFSSSGGGTNVTGSGTITTATDQISGIDLSGLSSGTITLSVRLIDETGNQGSQVLATITKVINDPPIAVEDNFTTDVNTPLTGNVLTNDSDLNGDNLSASLVTAAVNGTIVLNSNGGLTYTPNPNYIGLDSLRYKVIDDGVPSLEDTTMVYLEVMDNAIPTGYSVSWADALINESESNATILNISGATIGTTLNYTLSSSADGGTETVTGSSTILNASENHVVDVSSLQDGTLTAEITLTSIYGTPGITVSDNSAILDQTAPSGYAVSIDQNPIDKTNQSAVSFTFSSSEVGDHFDYTFSSAEGSVEVTGSGIISSSNQGVTDIDLSNLADGGITLSLVMEDPAGNLGDPITATTVKMTNEAPRVSDVVVSGSLIVTEQLSANYVYLDSDGDPETGSTYVWYSSDDSSGTGKSAIPDAVLAQYTLKQSDRGKYISFAVTPSDGSDVGATVESPFVGPAKIRQTITFPNIVEKTYGDAPFTLGDPQTDQGLTVVYTAADPTVVQINGNQATLLKAGITTIMATQQGDAQTSAAEPVEQELTVNAVELIIEVNDVSKLYGDPDPELTVNYSGFINGDDASSLDGGLVVTREVGESVGGYAISASGYTSDTYTINYLDGHFEIQPRPLHITVDPDQHKVYGQDEPELGYSVSGFAPGDDQGIITGGLSREPGEDAGRYLINIGTLSAGNNYGLQIEPSEFEILKADQEIVWNQELSFGCNTDSQVTLVAESSSGLSITYVVDDTSIATIEGDVLTLLGSGVATISAEQPGDQNHHPAEAIEKEVQVSQPGLIRQHWDDVLVFDNSSGNFVSYQWYKNGAAIAGATKQYYSEDQALNGSYYAVATLENGTQITTCPLEVSGESVANTLMVVPNPVRGTSEFSVKASFKKEALDQATISIIDLNGRILQTIAVTGEQTTMIAPSQTGIYIVVLTISDGMRKTVNLLVQ